MSGGGGCLGGKNESRKKEVEKKANETTDPGKLNGAHEGRMVRGSQKRRGKKKKGPLKIQGAILQINPQLGDKKGRTKGKEGCPERRGTQSGRPSPDFRGSTLEQGEIHRRKGGKSRKVLIVKSTGETATYSKRGAGILTRRGKK